MKRRAAALGLCLGLIGGALPAEAAAAPPPKAPTKTKPKPSHRSGPRVFDVCRHGCRYRTIRRAVDAAGAFQAHNSGRPAAVTVAPGRYREGVVLRTEPTEDFDGLTIEGTEEDPRRVALDGRGVNGRGIRASGIEAVGVDDLTVRDISIRGFAADGIFLRSGGAGGRCHGFSIANVLVAGNGGNGVGIATCFGGRIADSVAARNDVAGFKVATTPCDRTDWTVHGRAPGSCQQPPMPLLLTNDAARENSIGYLGTGARYVSVVESAFYDNGAGIVSLSPQETGFQPGGFNLYERNDVFWNDLNPYLREAPVSGPEPRFNEYAGVDFELPTGVGVALLGADSDVVRRNRIFGNPKWGVALFSAPGAALTGDEADEAESIDNEVVENLMGRAGADPDGEYEFFNDRTGGGNCWGANSATADFAPGNGKFGLGSIYPVCPQDRVLADQVGNLETEAGLQASSARPSDPGTVLGYLTSDPPQSQQCSWAKRTSPHPSFQEYEPVQVTPAFGELEC